MRLLEFASAEDTLELWRVISDNTWAAVAQQAAAEARAQAERAAARKSASKRGSSKSMPAKRLPPPLQHVTAPMPKGDEKTPSAKNPQADNAQTVKPQSQNTLPVQPSAQPQLPAATAAKSAISATAAVPQAVGDARPAAVQSALSASLPNKRFKALNSARA